MIEVLKYVFVQSNILLFVSLFGCNTSMNKIEELIELRDLSYSDVKKKFDVKDTQIHENITHEKLEGLTVLHNKNAHPGYFYFKNEKMVLIFISDSEFTRTINSKSLRNSLGEQYQLRSKAGKSSTLFVYPEKGFLFSESHDGIDFIEVFQPKTFEKFKEEIYKEPVRFIR